MKPADEATPPSPALAGWASAVLAVVALMLTAMSVARLPDGGLNAKEAAKLVRLEVIVCLLALFLGIVGRSTWPGRISIAVAVILLLAAAVLFAKAALA